LNGVPVNIVKQILARARTGADDTKAGERLARLMFRWAGTQGNTDQWRTIGAARLLPRDAGDSELVPVNNQNSLIYLFIATARSNSGPGPRDKYLSE
jgi:hypothetical protein